MSDAFKRVYLGEWPRENKREKTAIEFWAEYFRRTEAFDRILPGAWIAPNNWMPRGDHIGASRRYASQELRHVFEVLVNLGYTSEEIHSTKLRALKLVEAEEARATAR